MPYTKQQLLQALRQDHPEFSSVKDDDLFAALKQDHPELTQGVSAGVSPTLLASRQEISKQQFNAALPVGATQSQGVDSSVQPSQARRAVLRDIILGGLEHLGIDPSSPIVGTAKTAAKAIGKFGTPEGQFPDPQSGFSNAVQTATGLVKAPFIGPYQMVTAKNSTELGAGLADTLTQTVPTLGALGEGLNGLTAPSPKFSSTLSDVASRETINALAPRTREFKAVASKIAPELAARKITGGLTGGGYDNAILSAAEADGAKVGAAEDQLKDSNITLKGFGSRVASRIQAAMDKITVHGAQGDIVEDEPAISNLQRLKDNALKLGDNPDINTVIQWRRALDQTTSEKGGFKEASSIADKTKIITQRQVANVVRDELNTASPDVLAPANKNFHISRAAADIVEDRQLGKVGNMNPTTADALLSLGGYAAKGTVGAIAVPLAKSLFQNRGIRSHIAAHAQGLFEKGVENNFQNLNTQGRLLQPPSPYDLSAGTDTSGPTPYEGPNHTVREFTPKRLPAAGESIASTGRGFTQGPNNPGSQLWMRAGATGLPPSPMLDQLTNGVAFDKVPKEEFYKFDNIAKDATAVQREHGFNPIEAIDRMTGSPAIRAQILTRPEGRNVVGGLINAMKRQSGRDVGFYTNKLQELIQREMKRSGQ